MKERVIVVYVVKDKEVKISVWVDKWRRLNNLVEEVEIVVRNNCSGDLY